MLKPRYSGELSKPFWKRVNAISNPCPRGGCYAAAVLLQNAEVSVLTWLAAAEATARRKKRGKKKA